MSIRRNIVTLRLAGIISFAVCVPTASAVPSGAGLGRVASVEATISGEAVPPNAVPQERETFRYALKLYDSGMYERAAELFASLAGVGAHSWNNGAIGAGDAFNAPANGMEAMEIDFDGAMNIEALGYYVLCAVKMQTRGYTVLANSYILKYPYASLVPQIRFAHATLCFDLGDYKGADSQLEPLKRRKLYHKQQPDFLFMRALSSYELGDEEAAARFTDVINYKKSNRYILPAHYFLGYIQYEAGNLSEAKEHFALATADPRFKTLAEHYLVECGGTLNQSDAEPAASTTPASTGTAAPATQTTISGTASTSATLVTGTTATMVETVTEATTTAETVTEATTTTVTATETTATVSTPATQAAEANDGEVAFHRILDSYDRGKFDDVEERVLDFAESDNPNQYWLAKAFIILGDSYAEQGDFAKALATFESVRDGYNPDEPDDAKDGLDVRIRRAEEMLNKN